MLIFDENKSRDVALRELGRGDWFRFNGAVFLYTDSVEARCAHTRDALGVVNCVMARSAELLWINPAVVVQHLVPATSEELKADPAYSFIAFPLDSKG